MKYNTFKAIVYTVILIGVFTVITEAACTSSNVRVEAEDANTIIPPMQVASANGMDYMPGRLRISTENPHYFEYEGEPVLLFGSGDWHIIYGHDTIDHYKTELDAVSECGGNFIRMVAIDVWKNADLQQPYPQSLYPWARNGGGTANDGLERFDLNNFNPEYWDKLKNVIAYAKSKNMVVLLQLLGETGIEKGTGFPGTHNGRWLIHPFNPDNNNNDLLGLPSGDTDAVPEFYDLSNTKVIGYQEAYMEKMLDETSSYGNVIYELSNEYSDEMRTSTDPILWNWAKYWGDFFKNYEQTRGVQLLFTNMQQWNLVDEHAGEPGFDVLDLYWACSDRWWGDIYSIEHMNTILNDQWSKDKPLIFGRSLWKASKPADTVWQMRQEWWTEFTSGAAGATIKGHVTDKVGDTIRYFHEFVDKVKFWEMAPHDEVVTTGTGYCLANLGAEYVIYLPNGGSVTVDLSDASGILNVEWYDPKNGAYYDEGTVIGGGGKTFKPPFSGEAVLHIVSTVFDTCGGAYPSISGTHTGTIKPTDDITVQEMYTYPCPGTGGHSEYVRIWNNSGWNVTARWEGYERDWHNISFDKHFILKANETYNYTIRTGSYPQTIHKPRANVTGGGTITCEEFVDANGKSYTDWIPAIKLYSAGVASGSSSISDDMVHAGGDTEPPATVLYNSNNSARNRLLNALKSIKGLYNRLFEASKLI